MVPAVCNSILGSLQCPNTYNEGNEEVQGSQSLKSAPCQGQVPGSVLLPYSVKCNAALYLVWVNKVKCLGLSCLVIKPLAQLHKGMACLSLCPCGLRATNVPCTVRPQYSWKELVVLLVLRSNLLTLLL